MKLQPVIPFEPVSTDSIPSGEKWIYQIKWDGVRMLTYYNANELRFINRSLNERTLQYPELMNIKGYCKADSVILDGEVIAFDHGRPSFREVMRRDSIRKQQNVSKISNEVPVTYMVFDILYLNGSWVIDKSLEERQSLLSKIINPVANVQMVENFRDGENLFSVMKQHDMEGIICKDLSSTYVVNGKDSRWQKKKMIRDLIAVVGGVTYRAGRVNALLLGLYTQHGDLLYIGHAGTGKLKDKDWHTITLLVESIKTNKKPFKNIPERSKDAIWIQPILKVKINYMEWTVNKTLRQPSIQAFVDKENTECTFDQL
jgi:bifunctional non-homologous end joining protein LigD